MSRFAPLEEMLGFLSRLRWRAVHAVVRRHAVYSRGLNFTLQCNSWITHYRWATYNGKEPETLSWIDEWVRDGDVFFDIGANVGVYTIYAALRHPKARVVAFEPEYANLHLLRDNIVENGLRERVETYSIALSNCSGISRLHIQDFTPGSALHTESRGSLGQTLSRQPVIWREGIYTLTLDDFCDQASLQPDCMKIDVDGTEPKILEGAVKTLNSSRLRSLIIELPSEKVARDRSIELLDSAGFRLVWRDPLQKSPNEIWARASVS